MNMLKTPSHFCQFPRFTISSDTAINRVEEVSWVVWISQPTLSDQSLQVLVLLRSKAADTGVLPLIHPAIHCSKQVPGVIWVSISSSGNFKRLAVNTECLTSHQ